MKNTLGASFVNDFEGGKTPITPKPTPGKDVPTPSDGEVVIFDPTEPKEGDTPSETNIKEKLIERPIYTIIPKSSTLLQLPEKIYGVIKRVGILDNQPILYGDANLLKLGQLYYLSSAKQIYRFIKADTEYVYFTTIKPIKKDGGLLIAEEERGHIRNAGYLFNEIIYSGDPNLVENGSLFYHDTLPYISIISNVDGTINLSTKEIDENGEITTVITEYRVNPEPHDYSKDYFTMKFIDGGAITGTFNYKTSDSTEWETNIGTELEVPEGESIQLKKLESFDDITGSINISGNIMSLCTSDDEFEDLELTEEQQFAELFSGYDVVSAKNLILPNNTTEECYMSMFQDCTSLIEPPAILPATTLSTSCYQGMFAGCTSLTTAPELPAITLESGCYTVMFQDCTNLKRIKAMFTTTPTAGYTSNWVNGVPLTSDGIFIKNVNATWDVTAAPSNNFCGSPLNWKIVKEVPEYEPIDDEINI